MMYTFLLEVLPLPNEIVELIYGFMKVNAANVIGAYFKTAKQSNAAFVYLANYRVHYISISSIYSIRRNANYVAHYLKDEVITKLYNKFKEHSLL